MNRKANTARWGVLGVLLFLLCGCQEPHLGGSPFAANPSISSKLMFTNQFPIEAICYVDLKQENPLNAKDYILAASEDQPETQFFNYVVLAYSYLTKDSQDYTHLVMSPELQYILNNSVTFIKPLHLKGIKVLIEVRSGNFTAEEDGIGAGLGTMDMQSIEEFVKGLELLVNQYGIDGFEFNDVGGGKKSYPPYTRELKQFQSDKPLYPEELFKKDDVPLTDEEILAVLWREGGSNFSNLIQITNENLKETVTTVWKDGDEQTSEIRRSVLVRDKGHGDHLLSMVRMAYMPDAYSGASASVTDNLKYIIHDGSDYKDHSRLWYESGTTVKDAGEEGDSSYAPFKVDLNTQTTDADALALAKKFALVDTSGFITDPGNQNRYGALYFFNLKPVSEKASAAYLDNFTNYLFKGRPVTLSAPGAGDYKKTW
jgi:hypothetical protein